MKTLKLFFVFTLCLFLLSCGNETTIATADPLYKDVPNIATCWAGSLSEAEKQKVLRYINTVRKTHNLPEVEYDTKNDDHAQKAALIGAANASISEAAIVESDFCYTETAVALDKYRNGNRSLLGSATAKWTTSEIHVNDWMTELNSDNINYRRRILDPFLKSITFGRVIGTPKKGEFKYISSAILVAGYGTVDLSEYEIPYIAYPIGAYNAKLFDPNSFLSFSALYDKTSKSNNGALTVDFADVTVEVSVGAQLLEIVEGSLSYDYNNYGLPNNLQWKVQGLTKNVTYSVKITGVKLEGTPQDYEYTFSFK